MAVSIPVQDDPALLDLLLKHLAEAEDPWRITPYWQTYHERLVREIKRVGLSGLQNNYDLLKGFAVGGRPKLISPRDPIKRAVFEIIPKLPIISKVASEYERLIAVLHRVNIGLEVKLAEQVLIHLEELMGPISFPENLDAGDAQSVVTWRGRNVPTPILKYLCRAADFYRKVDAKGVSRWLEIGPGLGQSTLANVILNPHLSVVINVDIPSTLYISTQYLKATGAVEVIDYRRFLDEDRKIAEGKTGRPVCYQLPPWALKDVETEVDWMHNAFSFQEMEPAVVLAYADEAARLTKTGAWLASMASGHEAGAGGQKDTVSFDVIDTAMARAFDVAEQNILEIARTYDRPTTISRLYARHKN